MEYKGQAIQCLTLGNNIVELTFDAQGESVNKFDQNSLSELSEVVKELEADKSVSGLLVSSGKECFHCWSRYYRISKRVSSSTGRVGSVG